MKRCKITFALLLLSLVGLGHAIAQKEKNKHEANNLQEIYSVIEGTDDAVVSFANPKPEIPTLREIIYYHVIEKPYSSKSDEYLEGPDFDDSAKTFTNSHSGNQFFFTDDLDKETEKPAKPLANDNKNTRVPVLGRKRYTSPNRPKTHEQNIDGLNADSNKNPRSEVAVTNKTEELANKHPANSDEPVKRNRKMLFDVAKEKYAANKEDITTPVQRKKREIRRVIPVPPQLPDIDLSILPPHIFELISNNRKPKREIQNQGRSANRMKTKRSSMYRLNDRKENAEKALPMIRAYGIDLPRDHAVVIPEPPQLPDIDLSILPPHIFELISNKHKPKRQIQNQDRSANQMNTKMSSMYSRLNDRKENAEKAVPMMRTYGMDLTPDHGVVWNDFLSKPGLRFNIDVQESDNVEEINLKPRMITEEAKHVGGSTGNTSDNVDDDDDGDYSDVLIDYDKENTLPEQNDNTMMTFLENEKFWSWLSAWTSLFMENMTENIKKQIKDELKKERADESQSIKDKKDESDIMIPINNESNEPVSGDLIENTNKSTDRNTTIINNTNTPSDNFTGELSKDSSYSDNNSKAENEKINTNDNLPKNETKENTLKNINDKDILNKLKDSFNEINKKDMDIQPNINNNTPDYPFQVGAKTMYGNSVGNDRVVNIFMFYPNKEKDEVIKEFQSIIQSNEDSKLQNVDKFRDDGKNTVNDITIEKNNPKINNELLDTTSTPITLDTTTSLPLTTKNENDNEKQTPKEEITTLHPPTDADKKDSNLKPTTEEITRPHPSTGVDKIDSNLKPTTEEITTPHPTTGVDKIDSNLKPTTEEITTLHPSTGVDKIDSNLKPTTEEITTPHPTTGVDKIDSNLNPTTEEITTPHPTTVVDKIDSNLNPTTKEITTPHPTTSVDKIDSNLKTTTEEITTPHPTIGVHKIDSNLKPTTEEITTLHPPTDVDKIDSNLKPKTEETISKVESTTTVLASDDKVESTSDGNISSTESSTTTTENSAKPDNAYENDKFKD